MRCVKPPFPFTGMIRLEVIGIHTFDSDMIKPKPAAYLSILRLVRTLRMSSAGTEQSATAASMSASATQRTIARRDPCQGRRGIRRRSRLRRAETSDQVENMRGKHAWIVNARQSPRLKRTAVIASQHQRRARASARQQP
jgi:hypothetical protein